VGALVDVVRNAAPVTFAIESGLTVGSNTTVTGSALISDGRDALSCNLEAGDQAILHANGTTVDAKAKNVVGSIVEDARETDELMQYVLHGSTIEDVSALASIQFGPMFGKPAFSGAPLSTAANVDYRWGCPALLVEGCSPAQAAYYPVVALDANGGELQINGGHAQGVLIIRNGGIHINGNFRFQGILLVEGELRMNGNAKVEGAVVTLGNEAMIEDDQLLNGNLTIGFNRCQVEAAQQGMTLQSLDTSAQTIDTPTFAWFEVLR
jgi:hypothetical protein